MIHPVVKVWQHSMEQASKDEQEQSMAKNTCVRCGRPVIGIASTQNILCRACARDLFGDD